MWKDGTLHNHKECTKTEHYCLHHYSEQLTRTFAVLVSLCLYHEIWERELKETRDRSEPQRWRMDALDNFRPKGWTGIDRQSDALSSWWSQQCCCKRYKKNGTKLHIETCLDRTHVVFKTFTVWSCFNWPSSFILFANFLPSPCCRILQNEKKNYTWVDNIDSMMTIACSYKPSLTRDSLQSVQRLWRCGSSFCWLLWLLCHQK